MSKCPQVEIQELEERLEVAAYVTTDRQVYITELEEQVAQLQSERDSLMNDMQRIYDSCSDVDLIIDIAGAAVDYNQGDE